MHIQFLGLSCFKFTTKNAVVVLDPYGKGSGLVPPRGAADIIILTQKHNPLYSTTSGFSGEPFLAEDPGEYDIKGVTLTGIPLKQEDGNYATVFLLESEEIKVLLLGNISELSISDEDLEELGEIDVLILPVGGHCVLDAGHAVKVVNRIGPKLIIPSHYKTPGLDLPADGVEKFVKEMGGKSEELDKIIVKPKDLPVEGSRLVVLKVD